MEPKQTMTDEELSQKLGQYQRTESIGILLDFLFGKGLAKGVVKDVDFQIIQS